MAKKEGEEEEKKKKLHNACIHSGEYIYYRKYISITVVGVL